MTLTSQLVDTCRALYGRVNAGAMNAARRCLVDGLACAYAAYGEPQLATLLDLHVEGSGAAESTVIGYGRKARAADAALLNGTMISLQLFDDSQDQMRGHPTGPLLPAVLALAELQGASLADALKAFVVGFEVECRFGLLLNPSQYEIGWHATATQGTLAATVAASLLLGLDGEAAAHALGIAASMVGGTRRNFGTMTMSLHSGLAASNGVRAARLARRGFTADPAIFDGAMSLGTMLTHEWSDDAFRRGLAEWGVPFMIVDPGVTFKLYPCGRPILLALDCVIALRRKHGLKPDDVARIVADVSYMHPRTLIHARPSTGLQGKTSLQYCMATALLDGPPTLSAYTDEAVRRPGIAELIDRIELRVPEHLSEHVPAVRKAPFEQPLTVEITTTDGRVLRETTATHLGSQGNPAEDADLRQKFEGCAVPLLGAQAAAEVLGCLYRDEATVEALMRSLTIAGR